MDNGTFYSAPEELTGNVTTLYLLVCMEHHVHGCHICSYAAFAQLKYEVIPLCMHDSAFLVDAFCTFLYPYTNGRLNSPSIGSCGSRPGMREKGEAPVVSFTLVL